MKKIIAKEILIFFTIVGILLLVWCFFIIKNSYYNNKINSLREALNLKQTELINLPDDKIKVLYDKVSPQLVKQYKMEEDDLSGLATFVWTMS